MKLHHKVLLSFAFLFLVSGYLFGSQCSAFGQIDQAQAKIDVAVNAVNQAFTDVLIADNAGVNVTILLTQLNDAAFLLSQAENYYHAGDFTSSVINSNAAIAKASEVSQLAIDAKQNLSVSNQDNINNAMIITVIAASIFSVSLFLVWLWFKRNYIKNIYTSKPEVKIS